LTANISPLLDSIYCPTDSVKITASGGSSYQWVRNDTIIIGATAAVYWANKAGVYQAIVYSGTSCHAVTREATVDVTEWKPNIKSFISPATSSLCESQAITIRVQYDKTGPKQMFRWFKDGVPVRGITADTLVVEEAASYTVQESYCSGPFEAVPGSAEISDAIMASMAVVNASCAQSNGSVSLTVSRGTAPYTFKWTGPNNFSSTKEDVDGLAPGTYKVEIRDAAGCTVSLNPEIKQGSSTLTATAATTGASCGQSDGVVNITVSGGTAPYTYRLDTAAFGSKAEFQNLSAGSYSVMVKDAGDCTFEVEFVVSSLNSDVNVAPVATPAACGLNNGSISLTVSGGKAPYTFAWTGPGNFSASGKDIDSLAAGTYKVVVSDALGCTKTVNTVVKGATSTLKASAVPANTACGQTNGSVRINASGGTGPYSYRIGNGAFETLSEFKNLSTGSYSATIRDATNCTVEVEFTIRSSNSDLSAIADVTNASCEQKDGVVVLKVTGGTAPYIFNWTGPNGFTASSKDLRNLSAGVYKVEVQDALGCQYTLKAEVKQGASTLSATAATTPATCGNTSGSVQITAAGGKAPYSYSLDNGAFGTASRFSNVSLGSHKVVVKDGGNCRFEVVFTIDGDNKLPKVVINDPAPLCTHAAADLTAANITAGSDAGLKFTYWKDTAARIPLSNPAAASAGTYYIKGSGQNGCAVIKPVHVSINTTPAGTITPVSASVCAGRSALLTASTGTAYQWYYNGSLIPGATGATYSAAKAGKYNVFISDGNCQERASNTVAVSTSAIDTSVRILGPCYGL
jgi:hypothetical protein